MNKVTTSYILWLLCLVQINGVHRLYNGKIATGILWFCTFGLFGIGQFIDLIFIPKMVDEYNLKYREKQGLSPAGIPWDGRAIPTDVRRREDSPYVKLIKAASARGGQICITQAVMDTGLDFQEVEALLKEMLKMGYVSLDNHPQTGAVMYVFDELV